jgi:ABC-type uncharacterized transport system auxiliary subunit
MKILTTISILTIAAILAACDKTPPKTTLLTFEPLSLAVCDPAAEVIVKWDVRSAHPDVQNVQVFVTDGILENLFAEGNAWGDAKTGPWARPGKPRFVLKDKTNGKVLVEAAIDGPRCQ